MKPKFVNASPSQQLSTLADILESGTAVPTDLAAECASLIREALQNAGKLRLKKGAGAPKSEHEQFDRAFTVAMLIIVNGVKRKSAIQQVAKDHKRKFFTIEKDYKKWGKYARPQALQKKWIQDEIMPGIDKLKKLLATFEHDDRSKFSDAEIDELFEILPASEVPILVRKIEDGPLHRDMNLLKEVLS